MQVNNSSKSSWQEVRNAGLLGQLIVLSLSVWLHAADSLMVATIIPEVVADIGGTAFIPWTISLYEIGSIIAGTATALLVRLFDIRRVMLLALWIYLIGCLISALANIMEIMLIGRFAQGFGGGGLVALAFISVVRLFPEHLVPRAMATISIVWGVSAFTGPLVGGVFADMHLWRGSFWFFAGQAFVLILIVPRFLQASQEIDDDRTILKFPGWRLLMLSIGVVAIASAGIDATLIKSTVFGVFGIALLVVFFWLDRRQPSRLLPIRAMDPRDGPGAALLMQFCFSASTMALHTYGPILMITLYGISLLTAGYILALASIGWSALAIVLANLPKRYDGVVIILGMVTVTISIFGLFYAVPHGPLWLIAVFAFTEGAGFGAAMTFVIRKVTSKSAGEERDQIASAIPVISRLGYAVGASYIGIIANASGFTEQLEPALARIIGMRLFLLILPIAIVGLIACFAFVWHFRHQAKMVHQN